MQSMVCCISLVHQVMKQQPDDLQNSYPLVAYSPAEAVVKVWAKLLVLPKLLVKHLEKPSLSAASELEAAIITSHDFTSPVGETEESAAEENEKDLVKNAKVNNLKKISKAISDIQELLREEPKSLAVVRQICLSIREKIISIESLSTAKARYSIVID